MKSRFYIIVLLLLTPFQASLLNPLSLGGIKPDLALALIYIVGLLTTPAEATIAGIGIGLLQDIGSASLIGVSGLTRGMVGLCAGLLGKQVLDVRSPTNSIFIALFSLLEGILITLFVQVYYGSVPFFSLLTNRLLPQAIYTGLLGFILLRLINLKNVISTVRRETVQKEF
jgi:rod shape-determining protein MreD